MRDTVTDILMNHATDGHRIIKDLAEEARCRCRSRGVSLMSECDKSKAILIKRRIMKNGLPERFKTSIVERPNNLSASSKSMNYDDLADTLKIMECTQAIQFAIPEIVGLFGKHYRTSIKLCLKKRGINAKIAIKNEVVYVWSVKI